MVGKRAVRVGTAIAATACLLVAGQVGTAAAAPTEPETVKLVLRAVEIQHRDTDVGAKDTSVGDRQMFSEDLYKSDKKVGTDAIECVNTRVTRKDGKITAVESQCVGTLRLGTGQIAVQGLLVHNLTNPRPLLMVIVGGTRAYKNATGEMLVEPLGKTKSRLTLDMTVG